MHALDDDTSPVVDAIGSAVYTVPTDAPEGDGTLTWDSTTLVLVTAVSGTTTGLGYSYGAPAAAAVVDDHLPADHPEKLTNRPAGDRRDARLATATLAALGPAAAALRTWRRHR